MTVWLERLRPSDLQIMLPQVLLTLDQIRDQAMEPERRLAMLRALRDQVEAILTALPCPPAWSTLAVPGTADPRPLTLEQRLTRSWCGNLQRLLMELGQPRYQGNSRFSVYREWTLRQLLRGLGQGVEHAVRMGPPTVVGLWRSVYELLLYLDGRDELQGGDAPCRYRFNPEVELKRFFLLGGLASTQADREILAEIIDQLPCWAEGSELRRGESPLGEARLLRVDVTRDEPPQWTSKRANPGYSGWLLRPSLTLCEYLKSLEARACRHAEDA